MKIGLLGRILIAIALGVALGHIFTLPWVRIFVTFNSIFGQFLGFIIPLIILGLVTPALANVGNGWRNQSQNDEGDDEAQKLSENAVEGNENAYPWQRKDMA